MTPSQLVLSNGRHNGPHPILLELSENLQEVCAFGQREKEKRKKKKGKALKYSPCGMKNCSCKALERNALVYEYFLIKKRRRVLMSLCLKLWGILLLCIGIRPLQLYSFKVLWFQMYGNFWGQIYTKLWAFFTLIQNKLTWGVAKISNSGEILILWTSQKWGLEMGKILWGVKWHCMP